jgi:type VI secretion system protein ImpA
MSSDAPLDLESLLTPISEEHPGGANSPYHTLRSQFEEMRREVDPEDFSPDDPGRPAEAKRADWAGIEALATTTLRTQAKDLRVAGHLVEALLKERAFPGLLDGLRLVRGLVDRFWDHLYPTIEDGDLSVRSQPLANMLDHPSRGLRLPTSVRQAPLIGEKGKIEISYADWMAAQKDGASELAAKVDRAITATKDAAERAALVDGCLAELEGLVTTLDQRLGEEAPSMRELRHALEECKEVADYVRKKNEPACPPEGSETDKSGEGQGSSNGAGAQGRGVEGLISTRADAYRRLEEIADVLQRIEPHSPIPWLIRHAIELGAMPFPRLIKALIDDANQVFQLNRKLGIKDEDQPSG